MLGKVNIHCYKLLILKRLTSCYRKVGKYDKAIELGEHYIAIYDRKIKSPALYTSMAAAYCDIENYEKARKYANVARGTSGENTAQELINVYARIKKYDGGVKTKEDSMEMNIEVDENGIFNPLNAELSITNQNDHKKINTTQVAFKNSVEWLQ